MLEMFVCLLPKYKKLAIDFGLQFPRLSHHHVEISVRVDGSGHSCIIIVEFVPRDDTVRLIGRVERFQKFKEDVLLRPLPIHVFRVEFGTIYSPQVVDSDLASVCPVELFEGPHDEIAAALSHRRAQRGEQLVKGKAARLVRIKGVEHFDHFFRRNVAAKVSHSFFELIKAKSLVAVVIHYFEHSPERFNPVDPARETSQSNLIIINNYVLIKKA